MAEFNAELLNNVLRLLAQQLTGANAFNVPFSAFTPNTSYAHSVGTYMRQQEYDAFAKPMAAAIYGKLSDNAYKGAMRMLGQPVEGAEGEGRKFIDWASSLAFQTAWGTNINNFHQAAYRRYKYATTESPRNAQSSYQDAGMGIINSISDGLLQGYSIPEAFDVAAVFTRHGRYDNVENRKDAIVKDLKDYAAGINDLRDGLQGSLNEVLTAFEKLSGNAMPAMHKDRFNALSRSLYSTITAGGATPQLLQSAIATQNAYLQGLGTTQATNMAMGLVNANVLANGVTVEGASQNEMNTALNRTASQWVVTGQARNLSAAFGHWIDTNENEKERNAQTFQEFIQTQLGGSTSAESVQRYLDKNNVSGEYINSARTRRGMASPYFYSILLGNKVTEYEQAARKAGLSDADMWLNDDDLFKKLRASGKSVDEATRIVEDRRTSITNVFQGATDADNGLNLLLNTRQTLRQQAQVKAGTRLAQRLAGDRRVQEGLTGVITSMIKTDGVGASTIADLLSSYMGVSLTDDDIKRIEKSKDAAEEIVSTLTDQLGLNEKELDEFVTQAVQGVKKMSKAEREVLLDSSNDARQMEQEATGTTSASETWGNKRKDLLKLQYKIRAGKGSTQDIDTYKKQLQAAQQQGFISEKDAFMLGEAASSNIDFSANPQAQAALEKQYKTYQYTKAKLGKTAAEATALTKQLANAQADGVIDTAEEKALLKTLGAKEGDETSLQEAKKHLAALQAQTSENGMEGILAILTQIYNAIVDGALGR